MKAEVKFALVHDWFTVDGGAEKVCKEILNLYPEADIYSLIDFLNDEDREIILGGKKSTTSVIQKFPFAKKYYRYYLPWFPYAIEQLNLNKYDLIISSSYAVAKGVLTNSNQTHICYCHSPMRYLWDLYFSYLPKTTWLNFGMTYLMRLHISRLRQWDVISSNRVDYFIANSENIAQRIQKVYRRDSKVIYPPIDVDSFYISENREDYYVTASRLVPYKKVDLIVSAFKNMPNKKLVVLGDGPEYGKIKRIAQECSNITILGYVGRSDFIDHIAKAKAFINASNEDFGIAPVEAQASGLPVIGFAKGGLLETTQEGKTAIYFHEQNENSIQNAIAEFEEATLESPIYIREFSKKFSSETFNTEMKNTIAKCLSSR